REQEFSLLIGGPAVRGVHQVGGAAVRDVAPVQRAAGPVPGGGAQQRHATAYECVQRVLLGRRCRLVGHLLGGDVPREDLLPRGEVVPALGLGEQTDLRGRPAVVAAAETAPVAV